MFLYILIYRGIIARPYKGHTDNILF